MKWNGSYSNSFQTCCVPTAALHFAFFPSGQELLLEAYLAIVVWKHITSLLERKCALGYLSDI